MLGRRRIPVLLISATMLLTVGVVFVRRSQQPLESKPLPASMVLRHSEETQKLASKLLEVSRAQTEMIAQLSAEEPAEGQAAEDRQRRLQEATVELSEARRAQKRLEREQEEEATEWRRAETASERTRGLVTLALGGVVVLMMVLEVRRRRGSERE